MKETIIVLRNSSTEFLLLYKYKKYNIKNLSNLSKYT